VGIDFPGYDKNSLKSYDEIMKGMVNALVMRTLKILELKIPVIKEDIEKVKEELEKEFGDLVAVKIEGNCIKISGEQISNYKIHDRILELTEGV